MVLPFDFIGDGALAEKFLINRLDMDVQFFGFGATPAQGLRVVLLLFMGRLDHRNLPRRVLNHR